jgi:hypothetical protein
MNPSPCLKSQKKEKIKDNILYNAKKGYFTHAEKKTTDREK